MWNDPATGVRVEKTYIFKRGSYEIAVRTRVINGGTQPVDLTPYYQFTRHGEAPRGSSFFLHTFTGPAIYTEAKKFQKVAFKDIQEGKAEFEKTADNGWVGMVQHHFVSAWLPEGSVKREYYTRSLGDGLYSAGVILAEGTLAPGQQKTFTVPLFAGPQTQRLAGKNGTRPGSFPRLWLVDALGLSDFLGAGQDRATRRQLGLGHHHSDHPSQAGVVSVIGSRLQVDGQDEEADAAPAEAEGNLWR